MHAESTINLPRWQSGARAAETDRVRIRTAAQQTKKPDLISTLIIPLLEQAKPATPILIILVNATTITLKHVKNLYFCRQCLLCKSDDEYI